MNKDPGAAAAMASSASTRQLARAVLLSRPANQRERGRGRGWVVDIRLDSLKSSGEKKRREGGGRCMQASVGVYGYGISTTQTKLDLCEPVHVGPQCVARGLERLPCVEHYSGGHAAAHHRIISLLQVSARMHQCAAQCAHVLSVATAARLRATTAEGPRPQPRTPLACVLEAVPVDVAGKVGLANEAFAHAVCICNQLALKYGLPGDGFVLIHLAKHTHMSSEHAALAMQAWKGPAPFPHLPSYK